MERWGLVSLGVYVILGRCNYMIDTNYRKLSISRCKMKLAIERALGFNKE